MRPMPEYFKKMIKKALIVFGYEIRKKPSICLPEMNCLTVARLLYFKRLFDLIKPVDGDVVECGVGYGNSFLMLASLIKDEMKGRKLWGFDSFEGFPELSQYDESPRNLSQQECAGTSVLYVQNLLMACGFDPEFVKSQVTLIKGFLKDGLPKYRGEKIAFLHLDVDLYESYLIALQELYLKVTDGGIIAFDEYMGTMEHLHFPGAQKAIDEYLGEKKSLIIRDKVFGKYYLVKPPS